MTRFAPLFVIIAASLWGVDGIVLRPYLYTLPVPLVVFIESTVVAVLLTPFFMTNLVILKSLQIKDWLAFFGVALFGGAIGTMAITKALFYVNFVNLSIVVLMQKLQPVFALILAAVLLRERLHRSFFTWAILAIAGAYLMTFGFQLPDFNTGDKTIEAALFALAAAVSFALSTVLSKRALRNVSFELATYLRFIISSFVLLIVVLPFGYTTGFSEISARQVIVFVLIAFSTGGPAIFLYYYGLKHIKASVATICELSFPLTAIILEFVLRQNVLEFFQWIGVFMLLLSIIRVSRMKPGEKMSVKGALSITQNEI